MGKHIHRLSDVDPIAYTGTCETCGPVGLYKSGERFACARGPRKKPPPNADRTQRVASSEYHRISNADPVAHVGDCSQCGPAVPIRWGPSRRSKGGVLYFCVAARRKQRVSPLHGLSGAERDAMLAAQGGKCALPSCRTTEPGGSGWCVDHDHTTGVVRGVLCHSCNVGLGLFRDDPNLLADARQYVLANRED